MSDAADRKRTMDRDRVMAKRRDAGAVPRKEYEENSLTQTRPWEACGISRATYYRWNLKLKQQTGRRTET